MEGQISLTDPGARAMVAHGEVTIGYNARVAADAQRSLIVEQHVTNACISIGVLTPTAGAVKEVLGVEHNQEHQKSIAGLGDSDRPRFSKTNCAETRRRP